MSPFFLLIILLSAVFTFETGVMLFLPVHSGWEEALLDSTLLIALLLPILYFFVFRPLRSQIKELSKANMSLRTQITERKRTENALRESERELQYLSSQLLNTQEKERRRISRELHDELMQSLAVVKLRLSFIENGMNEDRTPAMMECKSLYHHIDGVIENVRRLSRDLSPSILEDLGLSAALQWLINNLAKNYYHVETSIEVTHLDLLFPQDSQIMIYRVFQEALTNVVKHAQASRLSVNIKNQNGSVSFSLEDDGKGFDLRQVIEKAENEKGLGLLTMHERVRLLRGSLDIWSQEGKGTRISFTVPMEESLSS